jgi:hypothetical protein
MHGVRATIPRTNRPTRSPVASSRTIRERLIKIRARVVIEHIARIRVQLPTRCPQGASFVALGLMPFGP